MKDAYCYPAVFDVDNEGISVYFPDFEGLNTEGDDYAEAVYMAEDALCGRLLILERQGEPIPEPSDPLTVAHERTQMIVPVRADMASYRAKNSMKSVNKMVTLPEWLENAGKEAGINFSQLMQNALMERLGIRRELKRRTVHR